MQQVMASSFPSAASFLAGKPCLRFRPQNRSAAFSPNYLAPQRKSGTRRTSPAGPIWTRCPRLRLPVCSALQGPVPSPQTSLVGPRGDEATSVELAHKDLLVVGPGVLGTLVAQAWLKNHPDARVVGQTNTERSHPRLRDLGITPVVKDLVSLDQQHFPYIIFCAPPSGSTDYPVEVRAAAQRWTGRGAFVFTSSSGLYDVDDEGTCDEGSPVVPLGRAPRTDTLLRAEEAALSAGGCVVRLAGLYTLERGAHTFWLKQGSVPARPDSYLNLIHYEDAASLCVAVLNSGQKGEVFMGSDNHPLTRQELMDITVRSGKFDGEFNGFTGTEGGMGKKMHNDLTRAKLGWAPRHHSFENFLSSP